MSAPPILILSQPRSGSTLLRLLLDTHPDICSPGELSLGRLCDTLHAAVEATHGPVCSDETIETRARRCLAETRRIVDELMARYCEAKGKQRWCEKSTNNIDCLAMLRAVYPDATYVFLHRHCLDVVRSSIEMYGLTRWQLDEYVERHGGNVAAGWVERWCDYTEKLLAFEAADPANAVRVTYEALVARPDETLRPILACIGVPWVADLSEQVFAVPHDLGRGDPKIAVSAAVVPDRVGRGRELDSSAMPEALLERMRLLLQILGYEDVPSRQERDGKAIARRELTSVVELFTRYFPGQLAHYASRLESGTSTLGIRVVGAEAGTWTIQVDASGARIRPGLVGAACIARFDATDLLNVANRKLTVAELRDRVGLEGDIESFDRPFGERLMWALFGDDFRPGAGERAEPLAAVTHHV